MMQAAAVEGYHTPLGNMRAVSNDPDAKLGSVAPQWLSAVASPRSNVVVISCASCSVHNVLPGLVRLAKVQPTVVLAQSASPSEFQSLCAEFPSLTFVPVKDKVPGLNLSITPKLYRLDSRRRFSYVQGSFLNNDDFFAQFQQKTL